MTLVTTEERPKAVIFDMDGTLCDVSSIRHLLPPKHLPRGMRNFDAFHAASIDCPPHKDVLFAAHSATENGLHVVILTARGEKHLGVTDEWLVRHKVDYAGIFMRPEGDERIDVEIKRDALGLIRAHWDPVHAWEDNPNIAELYRSEGIVCTVIPGWGGCAGKH